MTELQVMLEGVFEPGRFLALIRDFIVFEDDGSGALVKKNVLTGLFTNEINQPIIAVNFYSLLSIPLTAELIKAFMILGSAPNKD